MSEAGRTLRLAARGREAPAQHLTLLVGMWLAFTADFDADEARRRYRQRYGQEPAKVVRALGLLLAGPIGGEEASAA